MDSQAAAVPDSSPAVTNPILSHADKRVLLWLIAFSFFMQMLDSTIVNTATPSIAASMGIEPLDLRTALTSYTLALAVFIPLSSWLSDRYGTRAVFGWAILVFTLGSLACGLAPNLWTLVAARVVQGFGGALMMPVGRLALVRAFDKSEFVDAMAFATIPGLIGPAIGPVLGGFFAMHLSWRMIFFVNLPFGLIGLFMARRFMPDYRGARDARLDTLGFVLFALGLYVRHARRAANPIVDFTLLRIRSFRVAFQSGFATRLGVGGIYFLLTLLFQVGFGYTPIAAGLLLVPQAVAMMLMRFFAGTIIKYQGYRKVLLYNTALAGGLVMAFAALTAATSIWLICALVFVYGFVMSLQYTAMNTLGFVDLAPAQASMGSSMTSTAQNLSISFGIAFASLLMAQLMGSAQGGEHYIAAFRVTMLVLGGVTVLSALMFLRLPRRV